MKAERIIFEKHNHGWLASRMGVDGFGDSRKKAKADLKSREHFNKVQAENKSKWSMYDADEPDSADWWKEPM